MAGRIQLWGPDNIKDYVAVFKQNETRGMEIRDPCRSIPVYRSGQHKSPSSHRVAGGATSGLRKISQISLETRVDLPIVGIGQTNLFLVNTANELVQFNNSITDKIESHQLTGQQALHFWKMGNRLVIETSPNEKHELEVWSFSPEGLKKEWVSEIPKGILSGQPLV